MKALMRLLYRASLVRWRLTRPLTMGVRVLLVQDGQALLVKHSYQPYWCLVGGGVKRGETLEEAARREAFEEAGARLGALTLFGVFSNFTEYKSDHVAVFACHDFTYTSHHDLEIEDVRLFSVDALPADLAAGHRRRLLAYVSGAPIPQFGIW